MKKHLLMMAAMLCSMAGFAQWTKPAALAPLTFYTLDGLRLPAPKRAINIVRMSDGTARKVLVK